MACFLSTIPTINVLNVHVFEISHSFPQGLGSGSPLEKIMHDPGRETSLVQIPTLPLFSTVKQNVWFGVNYLIFLALICPSIKWGNSTYLTGLRNKRDNTWKILRMVLDTQEMVTTVTVIFINTLSDDLVSYFNNRIYSLGIINSLFSTFSLFLIPVFTPRLPSILHSHPRFQAPARCVSLPWAQDAIAQEDGPPPFGY